jgi:hypothetical protein
MTNEQAIENLRQRDTYLVQRIADLEAQGRIATISYRDRDAISIAIAAIEYVIAMQAWEALQTQVSE